MMVLILQSGDEDCGNSRRHSDSYEMKNSFQELAVILRTKSIGFIMAGACSSPFICCQKPMEKEDATLKPVQERFRDYNLLCLKCDARLMKI